jgi:hypothetical protein
MRFSATLALCAAPLALAGSLQLDLMKRGGAAVEVSSSSGSGESKKGTSNSNGGGNNVQISQSSTSITEVIVIWVNNGGNSATSTVNSMANVGAATAAAAAATHTVSLWDSTHKKKANVTKGYGRWWHKSCLHTRHPQRRSWRHGCFYFHEHQPHSYPIRFHYSL